MEKETTTDEIMGFLKDNMVTKEELKEVELKMATKEDLAELRTELKATELTLLDAMDDKLSDLKGDLNVMMRKEDKKVTELINILKQKEVLNDEEAQRLLAHQPFPQPSV